jgi:amino acid transporter
VGVANAPRWTNVKSAPDSRVDSAAVVPTHGVPGSSAPAEGLRRAIGTRALAANVVNMIVGSGIFVLPATVAGILGPAAIVAYVACAIVIGLIALCFAECGSRVAASGGPYAYIEAAFGPYPGLLAGSLAYLSNFVGSAAVATVLLAALAGFWPVLAEPVPRALAIVVLYGGFAALNFRGVEYGARFVEIATAVKLLPLVLLALGGLWYAEPDNFHGFHWPALADLGAATLALVFAFIGVEAALQPSGEVRDPARTVPRAIGLGLLAVAGLYGALQFAAQGVLGDALPTEQAPLAALARQIAGAPGGTLVLVATAISTFGYVASDMLSSPRVAFALARDGALPSALARVDPATRAPRAAIVAHSLLCVVLAVTAGFGPLALLSVVATLLLYGGCAIATLQLRRLDLRLDAPPFVVPGGPAVPLLALVVTLWLMSQATWQEYAACGAALAIVTAFYALRVRVRSNP